MDQRRDELDAHNNFDSDFLDLMSWDPEDFVIRTALSMTLINDIGHTSLTIERPRFRFDTLTPYYAASHCFLVRFSSSLGLGRGLATRRTLHGRFRQLLHGVQSLSFLFRDSCAAARIGNLLRRCIGTEAGALTDSF
jgi:hypothetical protein